MIARIYIWILLGTLLPYLWCFCHELRRYCVARRLLLWLPASVVIGYSGYLALQPNFVPDRPVLVDVWFVVMALFAVPVFVYALFSFVGWCVMKALKGRRNWGRLIGLVMGLLSVGVFLYGFTYGFRELEVKRVTTAPGPAGQVIVTEGLEAAMQLLVEGDIASLGNNQVAILALHLHRLWAQNHIVTRGDAALVICMCGHRRER